MPELAERKRSPRKQGSVRPSQPRTTADGPRRDGLESQGAGDAHRRQPHSLRVREDFPVEVTFQMIFKG